jgi:hypothetical protein
MGRIGKRRSAEHVAFPEEDATRWLEDKGGGKPARVKTAAAVAAMLRACLQAQAEWRE